MPVSEDDLLAAAERVSKLKSSRDLDGSVRLNGKWLRIPKHSLREFLAKLPPADGNIVINDTEDSGLFEDGRWSSTVSECQPPARVSIASFAYKVAGTDEFCTFAIPFDQGRIKGKPGKFNHETNSFDPLDNCLSDEDAWYNFGDVAWRQLLLWMSDKRLVFHNAKYDLHMFRAGLRLYPGCGYDFENNFWWDTLLVQAITEPLSSNALDAIGKELFEEGKSPEMELALKKNGTGLTKRYDLVDWWVAGIYACQDALLTAKLYYHQVDKIEQGHIDHIDQAIIVKEFKKMKLLYREENRGVKFKADIMREEALKMEKWVEELKGQLPWVALGKPANITGAKWWFFDHLDTVPVKLGNSCSVCGFNAKTGKRRKKKVPQCPSGQCVLAPSLDQEVVGKLAEMNVEGAEQWQTIGNMESALSKWYRAWPNQIGPDGRLRTNFRQCHMESDRKDQKTGGAISNRLSAERVQFQGFPNEEKLPADIQTPKKLIDADEGYEVWELDVGNAEIRVAAWASQDPALIAKVNSGANIHDENTKAIFNITEDDPEWNMKRRLAKIGVFSDFYGSGIPTMHRQFESGLKRSFPLSVTKDFKARLAEAYPVVKRASRIAQRKADVTMGGDGYIRLYNGRRRWFGFLERTHKAWNQVMQCNVAEAVSEWMLAVEDKYPGIQINQVHDSLWLEVPSDKAQEIIEDVRQIGIDIFERAFKGIMFQIDKKRLA